MQVGYVRAREGGALLGQENTEPRAFEMARHWVADFWVVHHLGRAPMRLVRAQWGVCIMAAHSNRWLLRGKWVAGQSVRCCFPVFGKELTVSFALALGRFFSSKGCQIERFIFSGTSIKG